MCVLMYLQYCLSTQVSLSIFFNSTVSCLFIDAPKELFEPCFNAVKTYLAGEPFREFETSMYFHRYVMIFYKIIHKHAHCQLCNAIENVPMRIHRQRDRERNYSL